jgi:hypothetical protein
MNSMIRVRNAQVYKTPEGWRFRARGGNWKTVGASEEAYKNKNYAIKRLIDTFPQAESIDIYEDDQAESLANFTTGVWPFRKVIWTAAS